ncbi:MAG: zinc-ribbon domain-containing protein [Eubacteriales bacterium]|nr:zinc-ribbon domain-containing protein [Eubacteriales bacterium]
MPFCTNCGNKYNQGTKFCPSCGAPTGEAASASEPKQQSYQQPNYQQNYQANQQQSYQQQSYQQPAYQAPAGSDVQENKVMGILAYLSFLVLIPLFAAKESPFARFHTNQGLVLAIGEIGTIIACSILSAIFIALYAWVLAVIIDVIMWLLLVGFTVFAVLGLVSACRGQMKPLPIFGNIKILK